MTRDVDRAHQAARQHSITVALLLWSCLAGLSRDIHAGPPDRADGELLFATEVLPLLRSKCFACHDGNSKELKGEFDLTSRVGMLRGGESGTPALAPGDPEASPLFQAVSWDGLEMPPKENDRLTPSQVDLLKRWITWGAPWPSARRIDELRNRPGPPTQGDDSGVPVSTSGGLSDTWTKRRYQPEDIWALRPLGRPRPPRASSPSGRTTHPVDAFVQRRIEEAGLQAAGRAIPRHLVRRAALDLTGLPPTSQQLEEFIADGSSLAMERLVERLLASPHYGQRWAQHWLDVVRYADSAGFANDFERPHAWRYRDYVIRSLNADKPYDRFLTEQIAGDELDPSDPECLIATGLLRMGPWEHTGMAVEAVTRQSFLDDVTNTVGETFLGTNMTCFKCHDHKFDPLPTRDYYRFQAIFSPTQFGDHAVPFQPHENTSGFATARRRTEKLLAEARSFQAGVKKKNEAAIAKLLSQHGVDRVDKLPPEIKRGNIRFLGLTDLEKSLQKITGKRIAYYQRELARYTPFAYSVYNGPFPGYGGIQNSATVPVPPEDKRQGAVQVIYMLRGGALESPGDPVDAGVFSAIDAGPAVLPSSGSGRRLALARWLTDPSHPMTARVIVNRVWQYHFGHGIVRTPNAFGKMGSKPTHPELLDFLARWFVDHGWSFKKLHRLIMTSETYQRSARHPRADQVAENDPDNKLLTFFPPRRLSAEELRDGLLAATGELNAEMGGPGCFPEINWEIALQPRQIMGTVAPAYQPSRTPTERNRRTIYAFRFRTLADPMLQVFNRPGTDFSCALRDETTVTPQVFSLFNGQFAHDRAIALAKRTVDRYPASNQQIEDVFQRLLGRKPTPDEQIMCQQHLAKLLAQHRSHPPRPVPVPTSVKRGMVEELTGDLYEFEDKLTLMEDYVPDLKPWQVDASTRALAEICLVLINSNEFAYVY